MIQVFHRFGVFHLDGTARTYGYRTLSAPTGGGAPVGLTPPVRITHNAADRDDCYLVPLDDAAEDWLRLMAEWHIYSDLATQHLGHGDCARLRHSDGAPHHDPRLGHIQLGGAHTWSAPPHPRVRAHMDLLRAKDTAALIAHFAGPHDAHRPAAGAYAPGVALRIHALQVHPAYDGSVALRSLATLLAPDGTPLGHGDEYLHRLPPNAWHGLTIPQAVHAMVAGHCAHLGLAPPPTLDAVALHLHPHGDPTGGPPPRETPPAASYDPAVRLETRTWHLHLSYHGPLIVSTTGRLTRPDGTLLHPTYQHAHAHHLAVAAWPTMTLPQALRDAQRAHDAHLNLDAPHPTQETPAHLWTTGYPGTTQRHPVPVPPVAAADRAHVRRTIVAAKEQEMGLALPPALHPFPDAAPAVDIAALDLEIVPQRPPLGLFARPHEEV